MNHNENKLNVKDECGREDRSNTLPFHFQSEVLWSSDAFSWPRRSGRVDGRCSGKTCQERLVSSLDPTRSLASQPSFVCKSM